jgi:transposase
METAWFDPDGLDTEGLRIPQALSLAYARKLGIGDMIDEACQYDSKQRILSPGNAAMAVMGTMFTPYQKDALSNIELFYSGSPVDRLFGGRVTRSSLNDNALGRNLDTIFEAGTEDLFYNICSRVKFQLHLDSFIKNIDPSNITIHRGATDEYGELPPGAPRPMLGHPKDGSTDRVQYNFVNVSNGTGFPEFHRSYDGNVDDTVAMAYVVKRLEKLIGDERMVAVGDSKLVTKELVGHMCDSGTFFVSKPPANFDDGVKAEVRAEALAKGFVNVGRIGSKRNSPEIEVYETVRESYGRSLRYIAYRKADRSRIAKHLERVQKKKTEELAAFMNHRRFDSENDARDAHRAKMKELGITVYRCNPTIRYKAFGKDGYGWEVSYKAAVFDGALARAVADGDVQVLVTNLPAGDVAEDPRKGASPRTVVSVYFGQWHVEGMFAEMKSGIGADRVYLETPSRECVMLFLISLAAMVRFCIKHTLRQEYGKGYGIPKGITAQRMYLTLQNVTVDYDRPTGRIRLTGNPDDRHEAMGYIRALGIDPVELI